MAITTEKLKRELTSLKEQGKSMISIDELISHFDELEKKEIIESVKSYAKNIVKENKLLSKE